MGSPSKSSGAVIAQTTQTQLSSHPPLARSTCRRRRQGWTPPPQMQRTHFNSASCVDSSPSAPQVSTLSFVPLCSSTLHSQYLPADGADPRFCLVSPGVSPISAWSRRSSLILIRWCWRTWTQRSWRTPRSWRIRRRRRTRSKRCCTTSETREIITLFHPSISSFL